MREPKPNRAIEALLHHGPVTAMIDETLLGELRRLLKGSDLAQAKKIAMQASWRLHSLVNLGQQG